MKNLLWNKTILVTTLLFAILLISGCRKEDKSNIDVCLSSFGNDIMVVTNYESKNFCKRSIVYRSSDNKNYEVVGEMQPTDVKDGWGVFIDTSLIFEDDYFYKVSYGGTVSQAQSLNFKKGNNPIRIYPNPFVRYVNIEFNPICMPYDVQIFDILGRNIFSENQITTATKQLDLQALPNGIYIIRLNIGNKVLNYRILKQQ